MRIAIIGYGTIARTAHVPAMAAIGGFDLEGVVTRAPGDHPPAPVFPSAEALLDAIGDRLDAAVIATPPDVRYAIAGQCLDRGLDVLLEKPPAATLGEIDALVDRAAAAGRVLFASWHSQHAPAVARAGAALAGCRIAGGRVIWHEDVKRWHGGQDWVWEAGGFGVFDPGINALSILTRILPGRLLVEDAELHVPAGRQTPIAARLTLSGADLDRPIALDFDWRPVPADEWTIDLETADGRRITLTRGGAALSIDEAPQAIARPDEYPDLFRTFAELVGRRESRVDREPLRIVEDAFLRGRRIPAPAFAWD
jgi:D-galactose 1-dehydrogenase